MQGKNLGVHTLSIDNIPVEITQYYGNQPLFRIPTQLSPRKQHTLTVENRYGKTSTTFDSHHYIVTTDLDGGTTHLIRTNRKEKGGVEEEWLALPADTKKPIFNLITKDSRYLLLMDIAKKEETALINNVHSYSIDIHSFHLSAPNIPARVASHSITLGSSPIDAILNNDGILLVLGKRSLTLVDANNPENLSTLGHTVLPQNPEGKTTYVDAIFLDDNKKIAVLETYSNRVILFQVDSSNTLTLIDEIALLPSKTIALSVDLEASKSDPNAFWVLEGPNYRLAGSKLAQTYKKLIKKKQVSADKRSVHQLQKVIIKENNLHLDKVIPTPKEYAVHFSVFGTDGRMYLSGTKTDFLTSDFNKDKTKTVLKKVKGFLWDSISFGRIVAIDLDTEISETISSGVGVYYHLIDVPDIGPTFSLLKLGPSFSFPYLTPTWGLGIKSTGTYAKRKMNKRAIFPPYSIGFVDYQY